MDTLHSKQTFKCICYNIDLSTALDIDLLACPVVYKLCFCKKNIYIFKFDSETFA